MKTIDKDLELAEKFFYSKEGGWYNLYLKTIMCEDLFDKLEKVFGKNLNYRYYSREEGSIALVLLPSMWLWVTKFEEKYIVNRYFVVDDEHVLDNQLATSSYDGLIKLLTREISNALDTSGLANASKDSAKPNGNSHSFGSKPKKTRKSKYDLNDDDNVDDDDDDYEKQSSEMIGKCVSSLKQLEYIIEEDQTNKNFLKFRDEFCKENPKKKYTAKNLILKTIEKRNLSIEDFWFKIAHLALMQVELLSKSKK